MLILVLTKMHFHWRSTNRH